MCTNQRTDSFQVRYFPSYCFLAPLRTSSREISWWPVRDEDITTGHWLFSSRYVYFNSKGRGFKLSFGNSYVTSSKALRSQCRVVHVINSLNHFIASRAHNSWPEVIHVNYGLKLLTTSRALTLRPRFVDIIHNPELFIVYRILSSWLRVLHVLYNSELFKATRALSILPKVVDLM